MILKIKKLLEKYLKKNLIEKNDAVKFDEYWSCKYFGYRFNENHWLGLALFHSQKTRTWFLGYGDDKKWYSLTNKLECLNKIQCSNGKEKNCCKGCYVDMDEAYERLVLSFLFSATEQEQENKFNSICDKLLKKQD